MESTLAGKVVLVPESRELDLFAKMLEAEGAIARRCPLVAILDLSDPAPLDRWLDQLLSHSFDDLVLMTGEGLRRILARADELGRRGGAIAAIAALRTITRGPKPARALREIGLVPGIAAIEPTSEGVLETVAALDLNGRRIALQCHPGQSPDLAERLQAKGAAIFPIVPYRYASHSEADQVADCIAAMARQEIDAVAFTSSPQIDRLFEVARARGIETELRRGLASTPIASIGPVVTQRLLAFDLNPALQPSSFHLKPLVKALVNYFTVT